MDAAPTRVRVVSGKGGVGKTVVATALALAEVQAGRRVLLAELHGHDRAAALLGVEPTGYALREVFDDLVLVDINAHDAIREYVLLTLRFEALYKAVFENRMVRHFVRLVPSLGELVMLGKIWYHAQETVRGRRRFDVIVVDAPATGHATALLGAPAAVEATVPAGPMRDNARLLRGMLEDPAQTSLHIVTTPEDMPVTEALQLADAAAERKVALGAMVINQRLASVPAAALAALRPLDDDSELAGVPRALALREARRQHGQAELARLPAELVASSIDLPQVAAERVDLQVLQTLAQCFAPACEKGLL